MNASLIFYTSWYFGPMVFWISNNVFNSLNSTFDSVHMLLSDPSGTDLSLVFSFSSSFSSFSAIKRFSTKTIHKPPLTNEKQQTMTNDKQWKTTNRDKQQTMTNTKQRKRQTATNDKKRQMTDNNKGQTTKTTNNVKQQTTTNNKWQTKSNDTWQM